MPDYTEQVVGIAALGIGAGVALKAIEAIPGKKRKKTRMRIKYPKL